MTDTELEIKILDLTGEWHDAPSGHEALDYTLVEWLAHKLEITYDEAHYQLYGNRSDGALL